jgi:hypothetical protein
VTNPLKKLLREPLVHFMLLGAAIFAAYSLLSRPTGAEPGKIVVTRGQLASMMESFTLIRQRPPTREELEGLIRERVRQEVYYREALALGLDKDDLIIRRRLQQKMEFVSDDIAAQTPPTDADLNTYLQAHADKFRVEQQFTFRQLYLDPEKHGADLAPDAEELLAKLNRPGGDTGFVALGDPFPLDNNFTEVPASEVKKQFGEKFATTLGGVSPGQWQGPVESAYGLHLVSVGERMEGRLPPLADVRDAVRHEWENAWRAEANEKFYQELLKRYTVTIEQPAAEPAKKLAATKQK